MVKKIMLFAWSVRTQFVKYFLIGASAVLLDLVSLYILKEYLHFDKVLAVVINQPIMINYVFFLNKSWSFNSRGMTRRQIARFYILAIVNYLISIIWMWFFNRKIGFHYLLVRLANIALSVGWNFLLYKFWVYKEADISDESLI